VNVPLFISGTGAVSPFGWNAAALTDEMQRPSPSLTVPWAAQRKVPARDTPPPWSRHPRFRRVSPISHFAASAGLEALGEDRAAAVQAGRLRLGIVMAVVNGCVTYSGRFYGEVLRDPPTASPILFPETVFNAPASHLAAFLNVTGPVTTLVGDAAQFLAALDMAALWLELSLVDAALVIGAEESDWLTAEGVHWLLRGLTLAEGAGAVLLERGTRGALLDSIVPRSTLTPRARRDTAAALRRDYGGPESATLLVDDLAGHARHDRVTRETWDAWPGPRLSPLIRTGHGMGASLAWQTVVAVQAMASHSVGHAVVTAHGKSAQSGLLRLRQSPI
jgi:3-oxoacyl-(acyl-carrier-protein) synthase